MDNPWGSPWAADDSPTTSTAAGPRAGGTSSSSPLPTLARLPSPDGLVSSEGFGQSGGLADNAGEDDGGGWGASLNDGGWGGAEDAVSGGWSDASSSSARASSSVDGDEARRTEAELALELSPVASPPPPEHPVDDDDDGFGGEITSTSVVSPVPLTPATASPPAEEASPFASLPPPPESPDFSRPTSLAFPSAEPDSAFATSDSFDDFAPFSSPPAIASAALAADGDDDPWGTARAFDGPTGPDDDDDADAWGSSAVLPADAGESDVPWSVEPSAEERSEAAQPVEIVEDEWATARRRAAIRAQRAPREVVERLTGQWSELAVARYPDPSFPKVRNNTRAPNDADADETEDGKPLDEAPAVEEPVTTEVDEHLNLRLEDLRSIAELLPRMLAQPESTTLAYPSSATHAQFIAALRLSLRLSNSSLLLNTGRTRPLLQTAKSSTSASPQLADEWWDRSRLGEEEERIDASEGGEEKRGWFGAWSRRTSAQPVSARAGSVDVGGSKPTGMAEKLPPTVVPPSRPSSTVASSSRPSIDHASSPALPAQQTAPTSAQAPPSPSLSLGLESPVPIAAEAAEPTDTAAASAAPAPSAVSRFLGRFSRKATAAAAAATPTQAAGSSLELSAGDFDFLAEVHGADAGGAEDDGLSADQGDFLSGFGVPVVARGKQAALDDFLSSKPSAALPKPLAPPPGRAPSRPSSAASFAGGSRRPPAPAALDDLSFLSFDGPTPTPPMSAGASESAALPSSSTAAADEWDHFMASPVGGSTANAAKPSIHVASTSVPILAPPLAPSRSASPAYAVAPPSASRSTASLSPLVPAPAKLPLQTASDNVNEDDDFGDFGEAPSTAFSSATQGGNGAGFITSSSFDDFADFEPAAPAPAGLAAFESPARMQPSPALGTFTSPTAPEPLTKSPRHAQGGSAARWPTDGAVGPSHPTYPSMTTTTLAGPLRPSSTAALEGSRHKPLLGASAGSISNMASLVSHARTASQSTQRGWTTSSTTAAAAAGPGTPLPAPLAPPPQTTGGLKPAQSFLDDEPLSEPTSAAFQSPQASTPAGAPLFTRPTQAAAAVATVASSAPRAASGPAAASAGGSRGALSAADLDFFDGL